MIYSMRAGAAEADPVGGLSCVRRNRGKHVTMKKTVWLAVFLALIALAGYRAQAAEEPTYMEMIQGKTRIITDATELIKKDKRNAEAYYARGGAHLDLGQIYKMMFGQAYSTEQDSLIKAEFEAAVSDFSAAIDLKPDLVHAYVMRGMAYGQMKLSAAAVADFTRAIGIDPNSGYAYYARGREYWANGDYLKAKEDYDKAVELDPQWKDNFYR